MKALIIDPAVHSLGGHHFNAVQRLQGNSAFELSSKELAAAEASGLQRARKSIASRRT